MTLTAVSLFAGVGGFDLAMQRNEIARLVHNAAHPAAARTPSVWVLLAARRSSAPSVADEPSTSGTLPSGVATDATKTFSRALAA